MEKIVINKKSKLPRECYWCKHLRKCPNKFRVKCCEKFAYSATAKSI